MFTLNLVLSTLASIAYFLISEKIFHFGKVTKAVILPTLCLWTVVKQKWSNVPNKSKAPTNYGESSFMRPPRFHLLYGFSPVYSAYDHRLMTSASYRYSKWRLPVQKILFWNFGFCFLMYLRKKHFRPQNSLGFPISWVRRAQFYQLWEPGYNSLVWLGVQCQL